MIDATGVSCALTLSRVRSGWSMSLSKPTFWSHAKFSVSYGFPSGSPPGNPYDTENFAWLQNVGFERLIDHPLRTRESVNAHETPVASITGYRAFREAMAGVYPEGHTGTAYVL